MYRAVLELKEKQIVTLEEELNALDNYIYLVKTRFDESITFEIVVSADALKLYVVPLALQLLVENAIKHNVVSHRRPLHVTIKSNGNQLLVANNLQPKQQQVESSGTGIRNINDRFKLTFDEQIDVQRTEHSFEVRIPLTKVEVL
jgi:two-component system, LytTR family, sensor kinase